MIGCLFVLPEQIIKDDGNPYVIYTPFKNRWKLELKSEFAQVDKISSENLYDVRSLRSDEIPLLNQSSPVPDASESSALRLLSEFISHDIFTYHDQRNTLGNPAADPKTHTSFLSPYIRFGLISLRQVYRFDWLTILTSKQLMI